MKLVAHGTRVPLLDCEFFIDGSSISIVLCQKPLNKYIYVPQNSCHAPSVFHNLAFSEALRTMNRYKKACRH